MATLETERLLLRPFVSDDLDELFAILGDPETMRYYPRPYTRDEVIAWIARNVASPSETAGLRLKLTVTAGSCPRWFTVSGPKAGSSFATVSSGTSLPAFARM